MIKYGEAKKPHQWAFFEGLILGTKWLGVLGQIISGITEAAAVYDPNSLFGVFGAVLKTVLIVGLIEGCTRLFSPINAQSFFNVLRGFRKSATKEDKDLRISGFIIFLITMIPLIFVLYFSYDLSKSGKNNIIEMGVEPPVIAAVDSSQYVTMTAAASNAFAADSLLIVANLESEKQSRINKLNGIVSKSGKELSRLKSSKDYNPDSEWFKNNIGNQSGAIASAKKELRNIHTTYHTKTQNALNTKRSELNRAKSNAASTLLSFQSETQEKNDSTLVAFAFDIQKEKNTMDWIIFLGIGFVLLHAYLLHLSYYLSDKKAEYIENPFDKTIGIRKKFSDVSRAKWYNMLDRAIDKIFKIDGDVVVEQRDVAVVFKQTQPSQTVTQRQIQEQEDAMQRTKQAAEDAATLLSLRLEAEKEKQQAEFDLKFKTFEAAMKANQEKLSLQAKELENYKANKIDAEALKQAAKEAKELREQQAKELQEVREAKKKLADELAMMNAQSTHVTQPTHTPQTVVVQSVEADYSKTKSNLNTYYKRLLGGYTDARWSGVVNQSSTLINAGYKIHTNSDGSVKLNDRGVILIDDVNNKTLLPNCNHSIEWNNGLVIKYH